MPVIPELQSDGRIGIKRSEFWIGVLKEKMMWINTKMTGREFSKLATT